MDGPQRSLGTEQMLARGREAIERVTGFLQKGLSLYCLKKMGFQGQGSLQVLKMAKQQSNTKQKLIMISRKEEDNLHW